MGIISASNTTLTCQRFDSRQGNCQLTHSRLLDAHTQIIPLDNLQGAKIVENKDFECDVVSKDVVLLTRQGEVKLWIFGNTDIANNLNYFVINKERIFLDFNQDNRYGGWIFGIIYLFIGWLLLTS